MKRYVWCFVLMIFSLHARNRQEAFLQANKMYHEGKSDQALSVYESFPQKGSCIWYNMGNCYYKQGEFSRALACWNRAKKGARWQESLDIEQNECVVLSKLGKKISRNVIRNVYAQTARASEYVSLFSLQLLILFFWYMLLLFGKKIPKGAKCILFRAINGTLIVMFGFALVVKGTLYAPHGIILQETPVFTGPDDRYQRVHTLAQADAVSVCDQRNNWCKVQSSTIVGWVPIDKLDVIS